MIMVLGEVSCNGEVNYEQIVRKAAKELGYDSWDIGLDYKNCQVIVAIDVQSGEIAQSVHMGKDVDQIGAGDQGFMMGYATNETEELMPLSHVLATKLLKKTDDFRKDKTFPWARPDMKSQVTVEYEEKDGHLTPLRVHTVLMSIQHSPDVTSEHIREEIKTKLIKEVIPEKYLTPETKLVINPSNSFVIGGPRADAGVTGRKIIVDTYGGWGGHGGGAFSGKDGTKVDRSGAYAGRWIAKSLVHNKFCERCIIQIAYGIGIPDPISINVNSYGSVAKGYTDEMLVEIIKKEFNLKPGRIIEEFKLRRPIYKKTTLYCHFLKNDPDLLWEVPKDLSHLHKKE
jgi:S-adenosylmethionine synthetase